ncbi:unnamed protein product, partial [Ectocarpus sp. 12 AP-2014]
MRQLSDVDKHFLQYTFMDDPNESTGGDQAGYAGHDQNGGGGDNGSCRESCGESDVTVIVVGDAVDLVRLVPFGVQTRDTSVGVG